MLEAILIPLPRVEAIAPDAVWITWCDQVGISDATVAQLRDVTADGAADVALPTLRVSAPYVHLARDERGRIVRVLQRREGDAMPETGETDGGLFALSAAAYLQHLPAFAGAGVASGARTGERNFTPFIPWMGARGVVRTFPLQDPIEAVGINTPEELQRLEAHLEARRSSPPPAAAPSDRP
jgi:bifunctional N-acetylglucosamine-1-phosphate-uridyltransferase/glucosamine-1-phosphate-acetyltransferase GlmU-like protein